MSASSSESSPILEVELPPEVSVIIPTVRRPHLVMRAVRSALSQTGPRLEVIVVVDGPDRETIDVLRAEADSRLRVIVNSAPLGAAGARSTGAAAATAEWIAFLDDDDEWLPGKLSTQLSIGRDCGPALITCRSRVIRPTGKQIWSKEIYDNSVHFDEYMFDRRGIFAGWAFIQTSSLLLKRETYQRAPFPNGSAHDDWEFVLRLTKEHGLSIQTAPDILVQHYVGEARHSLTDATQWTASLTWLDQVRSLLSPRAYSGICLGVVGSRAARECAYGAFVPLLWKAFRYGAPRPLQLLVYVGFWLVPERARRRLRAALHPVH